MIVRKMKLFQRFDLMLSELTLLLNKGDELRDRDKRKKLAEIIYPAEMREGKQECRQILLNMDEDDRESLTVGGEGIHEYTFDLWRQALGRVAISWKIQSFAAGMGRESRRIGRMRVNQVRDSNRLMRDRGRQGRDRSADNKSRR